jgi:hypothetical protein
VNVLVVVGSAPCTKEDLAKFHALYKGPYDYMAIGKDADVPFKDCKYFATYHIEDVRLSYGLGPYPFKLIHSKREVGVDIVEDYNPPLSISGSSAILGVKAAINLGYRKIVLCGVPLQGKQKTIRNLHYDRFVVGWKVLLVEIEGIVRSMSGSTKDLLGMPTKKWLEEARA